MSIIRGFCQGAFVLAVLFGLGFVLFLRSVPAPLTTLAPLPDTAPYDAIVVLTGEQGRITEGLSRFARGDAPLLLISGAWPGTTVPEILAEHARKEDIDVLRTKTAAITLGMQADSTYTNATETRDYFKTHPAARVLLITSHYHMPRSLLELRFASPDVVFTAVPTPSQDFAKDGTLTPRALNLLAREYLKMLLAISHHALLTVQR